MRSIILQEMRGHLVPLQLLRGALFSAPILLLSCASLVFIDCCLCATRDFPCLASMDPSDHNLLVPHPQAFRLIGGQARVSSRAGVVCKVTCSSTFSGGW